MGEDRGLGDDAAGVAQQVFEQRELPRAELDRLRAALDLAGQEIERQVAGRQTRRFRGAGRAPDERLHAGEQLGEGERLGQVVVAAGLEAADAIVDGAPGAEDQHRHADAPGAQRVDQRQPVHARQLDVDDRRVVGLSQRLLEARLPVGRPIDREPRFPEPLLDKPRNRLVVLDQEHAHQRSLQPAYAIAASRLQLAARRLAAVNHSGPAFRLTGNYTHCGYNHPVTTTPESLLPLPPATFHILVALADEDRHGYAIMQDVTARTGGELKLGAGTLYRSVQRMLEQGLIVEVSARPAPEMDDERRRYYRITPFGRSVAKAEARRLAQMLKLARASGFAPGKGVMRLYRALLHLYPASFRGEYGEEMAAIFRRRLRDADGPLARLALFTGVIWETIMNALAEHWDILRQDLRYTARSLSRARGFALTAILIVGLGVGANTAAFSLTDFVLFRPLPFPADLRLVTIWERTQGYGRLELSPANYRDWKAAATSFERVGAYTNVSANLVGSGEPERLEGAQVTGGSLPDARRERGARPDLHPRRRLPRPRERARRRGSGAGDQRSACGAAPSAPIRTSSDARSRSTIGRSR